MHKTLIALATAAAFAGAGIALPSRAEAQWWVIPAIVAAGVGTVVVATAVAARDDTRPYATGTILVRPYGSQCYFERRQTPQGLRNVQVCY